MSRVLFVDDEVFMTSEYVHALQERGIQVTIARSLAEAKTAIAAEASILDLVITDIMMPGGEGEDPVATHGGFRSGLRLAQWLKDNHRDIPIVALTVAADPDVEAWFEKNGASIIRKPDVFPHEFPDVVAEILDSERRPPRIFIVHGHDDAAKYSLKNYLQNTLRLPEPIVLHEQPNEGRTILEKFEFHATRADVVFVLLTPDDATSQGMQQSPLRRARQNVVFELGYFLGRLGRKKGRVIVLHRGPVELPSDILGLVYIDISNGIDSAGEQVRRELHALWPTAT